MSVHESCKNLPLYGIVKYFCKCFMSYIHSQLLAEFNKSTAHLFSYDFSGIDNNLQSVQVIIYMLF